MPSTRGALQFLNATAATFYIAFTVMRHFPLEAFPLSWRPALLRWRRTRRAQKRAPTRDAAAPARKDPFVSTQMPDARFKAWPSLNHAAALAAAGVSSRARLEPGNPPIDSGSGLAERFSRTLAETRAVDRKEFFESWELFAQVRGCFHCAEGCSTFVEVAAGHGLLGVLVALFEARRFERVLITDRKRPDSFAAVLSAAAAVAPWVVEKIEFLEQDFTENAAALLPAGSAVACVHACKSLTDEIIRAASEAGVETLAAMPCCYGHSAAAQRAPLALRRSLGVRLAADIDRTYTLEAAGFEVSWRHVPAAITPMNRVLVARRRRAACGVCASESEERGR